MSPPATATTFPRSIVRGFGPDRVGLEQSLQKAGTPLAITDRAELLSALGHSDAALITLTNAAGHVARVANIAATTARVLPGHHRLRVSHFGASDDAAADDQMLQCLAEFGRADFRCLSLSVELFERHAALRARLAAKLQSLGFEKEKRQRSYQNTLALDLSPTAEQLLANLHHQTRRDVRAPGRKKMELRPVDDVSLAAHLDGLIRQTFARTGGVAPSLPWKTIIELSAREPKLSRLSGVFDPRFTGPDSLVSFAWGINHGSHTTYEAGASARRKDVGNFPLGYAPMWDLVKWAKETGSAWFDFGGITSGDRTSQDDPFGGISSFKRSFSDEVVEVGEEWTLHPNPVRSSIAGLLTSIVRSVSRNRGSS